jgi:hypothetical protein
MQRLGGRGRGGRPPTRAAPGSSGGRGGRRPPPPATPRRAAAPPPSTRHLAATEASNGQERDGTHSAQDEGKGKVEAAEVEAKEEEAPPRAKRKLFVRNLPPETTNPIRPLLLFCLEWQPPAGHLFISAHAISLCRFALSTC